MIDDADPHAHDALFISYAQNREDVVLARALAGVENGVYVEVGANHPRIDSVSRSFYDQGWHGLAIEPNPSFARLFREERPRDTVVEAAVTDRAESTLRFHVVDGTGLSTLDESIAARHRADGFAVTELIVPTTRLDTAIARSGLAGEVIHFMVIDAEGAEAAVLESIDLTALRPWVLVVESTAPRTTTPTHTAWEPRVIAAGYEFCIFDGISRYYVTTEKRAELGDALSYPACPIDRYITASELELKNEVVDVRRALDAERSRRESAESQLATMRHTVSWMITRPLRWVRRHVRHG